MRELAAFFEAMNLDARVAAWASGEAESFSVLPSEEDWPLPEVREHLG